jgi:hypothetical protein
MIRRRGRFRDGCESTRRRWTPVGCGQPAGGGSVVRGRRTIVREVEQLFYLVNNHGLPRRDTPRRPPARSWFRPESRRRKRPVSAGEAPSLRDRDEGVRHIARRHPEINSRAYNCIKRVLANAPPEKMLNGQWRYERTLRGGDWARVYVDPKARTVVTAHTKGFGKSSARWSDCVNRSRA